MDKSNVCSLVSITYTTDSIGSRTPTETLKSVFCNVKSVSRSEWFEAGNVGLKPEYQVTMFAPDYNGEEIVVLDNVRYSVYRTYLRKDENIELYLERKAGS